MVTNSENNNESEPLLVTPTYHRTETPKTHLKLLKCPNFCGLEKVFIDENVHNVSLKLRCAECNSHWYICFNCKYQSKHFITAHQLKRHFYATCKSKLIENNHLTLDDNVSRNKKKSRTESVITSQASLPFQFDTFSKLCLFGRKQNQMFYFYEQFNQGPHYLVGLSHYKLNNIASVLDTTEVYCHFRLAYLFLSMSPIESYLQTRILNYFYKYFNPTYNRRRWGCSIPLDTPSIRRLYTEGTNSILQQLPHPNIVSIDGHSYVPISEVIQDCLANDNPICDLKNVSKIYNEEEVQHIWDSKNVKSIVNLIDDSHHDSNETIHIMIVRWSDDFEPNNIKKNKGNSVWTMTITIIGSESNQHHEENTYIVAIGHKGADHSSVERRFLEDIRNINKNDQKYYVAYSKKIVSVRVHLIACVADLPERCDTCNISRGNSNYTTRWGYCSHIKVLQKNLRACINCFDSCLKNINDLNFNMSTDCENCLNWDFDRNNELTKFPVPSDFPEDSTHVQFQKISFTEMISACEKAEIKYVHNQWTASQVTTYLSHKGIKQTLITKILEHGDRTRSTHYVDNSFRMLLQHNFTERCINICPMQLPAVWYKPYEMKKWIDAPMHLLFLGVVKKTNSVIEKWATLFNKQKKVNKSFSSMLTFIFNMKLEWCKILPLCPNMSFGGFVSENWAAVGRLFCWMYQTIPIILTNEEIDTETPDKPLKNWTGAQMRKWLVLHGLKRSGNVSELRERIRPFIENEATVPPVISKYRCPPEVIRNTIVAMHHMISRLMQKKCSPSSIDECKAYIHLYLNFLAGWTQYLIPSNKKPLWLSSYSMLNLLNLPEVMKEHGPLRNFWEGSTMGEGILKRVKEHYSRMSPNWHMSLTKRVLQFRSLHLIHKKIERLENPADTSQNDMFKEIANNYHVYPDSLCLQRAFANSQPISIIVCPKMRIYAVVTCDILYEIEIRACTEESYGHYYYLFHEPKLTKFLLTDIKIIEFGLMLPRLTGNEDLEDMAEENCYTIITSEWKQIDGNKNILLPTFNLVGDINQLFDNIE